MLFNSAEFIFGFMPMALLGFYLSLVHPQSGG
jgi:hypothetical protein